jgi:hypothetical protein
LSVDFEYRHDATCYIRKTAEGVSTVEEEPSFKAGA